MTTFAITTLGCKVNAYESQGYAQRLSDMGMQEVGFKECADIYIINTCAVTNTAAAKSRQKIHQAQRQNQHAMIVVTGCYAQSDALRLCRDEHIDLVVGSDQKEVLPQLIQEQLSLHKPRVMVHDMSHMGVFEALPVRRFAHQTRAYLKIQDGCNQFCSYCIIPYARGRERSLAPDAVIQRAVELVSNGHLEIVLTGIHTGRYGREHQINLTRLLERMCDEVRGLIRIRISSIEINEISDELIALMKRETKIARHLHIPLQSADNDVLRAMHRPYTIEAYAKRVEEIRAQLPGISISADVITGFPGESEAQFLRGMQTIRDMKLSFLHVFPFSKRDGTKAALLDGQLSQAVKKRRCTLLTRLSDELKKEYETGFVNRQVNVLWEREENGMMFGHTSEYMGVYAPLDQARLHTMETITLDSYKDDRWICKAAEVIR